LSRSTADRETTWTGLCGVGYVAFHYSPHLADIREHMDVPLLKALGYVTAIDNRMAKKKSPAEAGRSVDIGHGSDL
jgi:hypothetical protein